MRQLFRPGGNSQVSATGSSRYTRPNRRITAVFAISNAATLWQLGLSSEEKAVIPTRTGRGAAVPLRYSGGSGQSLCVAVCVRTHVRVHVSTAGLQLVENATYTYELLFYKAIEEHPDDVGSATEKSRHMVLKYLLGTALDNASSRRPRQPQSRGAGWSGRRS
ncbi:uncharacterized protein LOC117593619 isoform X2 [Esox lucius]|uniref:uncharacterized protein LOC117593619 isoform X2 n=1 Tax=Esox lucius TaxID=8010 RepID=UPI001476EEE9|nr:uncharacterized protein LOC117593619 isoform X2 [Esox lucius]